MGFEILVKENIVDEEAFFKSNEGFELTIIYNESERWKVKRNAKDILDLQNYLRQILTIEQQDKFQIDTLSSIGYVDFQKKLSIILHGLNDAVWEMKPLLQFLNENKNLSFIDQQQFDRINAQIIKLNQRLDFYESYLFQLNDGFQYLSKRVETSVHLTDTEKNNNISIENKDSPTTRIPNITQHKVLNLARSLSIHTSDQFDDTPPGLDSARDNGSMISTFTSKESVSNSVSIISSAYSKENNPSKHSQCSNAQSHGNQFTLPEHTEDIEIEATILSVIQNKLSNEKDWQVPLVNDLDRELKPEMDRNMSHRTQLDSFRSGDMDRTCSNISSIAMSEELGSYFGLEHVNSQNMTDTENIAVWATVDEPTLSPNAIPFTPHSINQNRYVAPIVKKSNYHSVDLYNIESVFLNHENSTNEIMEVIQPDDHLLKARTSMIRLLKKKLRKGFACNVFEIGIHGIRCFLPSDPIKLAVIVNKKLAPYWHNTVEDILKKASIESAASGVDLFPSENTTTFIIKNNEIKKTSKKVTFTTEPYDIEFYSNSRVDLCMLAFLEEIAQIVGKDNLFKRSILLIRAWWCYETVAYVGISIKHYLNDLTICIMVSAIFNQYHARITSPLQALCLFLAEYSSYDGTTHVITLQGIVPYVVDPTNLIIIDQIEPQEYHLLSSAVMEKYWNLFHLNQVLNLKKQQAASSTTGISVNINDINPIIEANEFIRSGFEVLHPFDGSNMVTERLSARALVLLSKALMSGAQNISLLIYQVSVEEVESHINLVNGFFPALLSHFADRFRHDAFGNITLISSIFGNHSKNLLTGSIDKLWQSILYCNFIIESVISESAILTFCIDELSMFGPMVTDDLVERLGIISNTAKLIVTLNEKFGGLKKFLERFPDVFVFSDEHPTNPHVILRVALSYDLQAKVVNGILPANLCAKYIQKIGRKVNPLNSVAIPTLPIVSGKNLSPNTIGIVGPTNSLSSARNVSSVNSSPNLTSIHSARSSNSSIEKPSLQDLNTPYNSYFSNQRVGQNSSSTGVTSISSKPVPPQPIIQSSSRLTLHDVEYQQGYFDSSSDSCIDDHHGLLSSLRENSTEYRDSLSQRSGTASLNLQFEDLPPVAGIPSIASKKGYRPNGPERGYGNYPQNIPSNTAPSLIPPNHNRDSEFSLSSREYGQSLGASSLPPPYIDPRAEHKHREYDSYYPPNAQRYPGTNNVDYGVSGGYPLSQYNNATTGYGGGGGSNFDSREMNYGEQYSDRNKPRYFRNKRYDTSQQFK